LGRTTQFVGLHNLSDYTICRTTQPVGRQKLKLLNFCRPTKFVSSDTKRVSSHQKFVFLVTTPLLN
jgi:hypothetical protein